MKRKLIVGALVCLALLGAVGAIRKMDARRDGFSIERITSHFGDTPNWEVVPTDTQLENANKALNQPYYYLAHGFQCFAFLSQDGQYVLKFIRHQRLRPHPIIEWLPNISLIQRFKEEKAALGAKRANYLFKSLKVSFEDVAEETGLLMVHLNKTKGLYPTIRVIDKAGSTYMLALDNYQFVVQKKALLIKPEITRLMSEGKIEEAKKRIDQIFELLVTCAKKGIADNDHQLIRKNNLGFLPDRAIYIDTGKLTRKESIKTHERFTKDLDRLEPLYEWLLAHYPDVASHYKKSLATCTEIPIHTIHILKGDFYELSTAR